MKNKEKQFVFTGPFKETGKWLIAPFILSGPSIEKIRTSIQNPENIFIRFARDAWQGAARLNIIEKYLGGRQFSLFEMEPQLWTSILNEALTVSTRIEVIEKEKNNK